MSSERYVDIRGYQQSNSRESVEDSFVGSIVDVEQVCPLFLCPLTESPLPVSSH